MNSERKNRADRRIFDIIQIGNKSDIPSRAFDIFVVAAILLNITSMFLQTFDGLAPYQDLLHAVEVVTVIVFIIEYALRIYTARFLFPGESPWRAAWKFVFSFNGIVDLLTILPLFFTSGFVVFRMLRVVRIFRLFRINATYDSFNVIKSVLYEKRNQIASSVFILLVLMLASSISMYNLEHEAQPESFRNAFSGIWWSVSALVTVGYGDICPVTTGGKILAIIISLLGVGVVALPTGIISAGFVEQYTRMQNEAEGSGLNLQTVVVDIDSRWLGKSMEEIEEESRVTVVMAERGDITFLAGKNDAYRVEMGDVLIVFHKTGGQITPKQGANLQ